MPEKSRRVKQSSAVVGNGLEQRAREPHSTQKQGAQLLLPAGERHLEALRLVTHEWLVPRLVEEFLRERGIQSQIHLKGAIDKQELHTPK